MAGCITDSRTGVTISITDLSDGLGGVCITDKTDGLGGVSVTDKTDGFGRVSVTDKTDGLATVSVTDKTSTPCLQLFGQDYLQPWVWADDVIHVTPDLGIMYARTT